MVTAIAAPRPIIPYAITCPVRAANADALVAQTDDLKEHTKLLAIGINDVSRKTTDDVVAALKPVVAEPCGSSVTTGNTVVVQKPANTAEPKGKRGGK